MSILELWALDDDSQVHETINSFLDDESWRFTKDGQSHGLNVTKFFNDYKLFEKGLNDHLKEHPDPRSLPMLFLLDGNLGSGNNYGGFRAWRLVMNAVANLPREEWPFCIIYTRAPDLIDLAEQLSSEPANPIILPFGGSQGRGRIQLEDARYGFSEWVRKALKREREKKIRVIPFVERKAYCDNISSAACLSAITLESAGQSIPLATMFPKETRSIVSEEETAAVCRQTIVNELMSPGQSFRSALREFVYFFLNGEPGSDPSSDGQRNSNTALDHIPRSPNIGKKCSHWIRAVERQPATHNSDCVAELIKEADRKWSSFLGSPASHRRAGNAFIQTEEWQMFLGLLTKANNGDAIDFDAWKGFIKGLNDICHTDLGRLSTDEPLVFVQEIARSIGEYFVNYWDFCGIFPRDAVFIQKEWCSVTGNHFVDAPSDSTLAQHVRAKKAEGWFSGGLCEGIHVLCDLGIPPADWRYGKALAAMEAPGIREGSLNDLCDLICRVYEGQFILFKMSEGREQISGVAVQGPHGKPYSLADQRVLRQIIRLGNDILYPGRLQCEHVYNLLSFRRA